MNNEGKRLVKNSIILAIGGISTKIISFLLLPMYTSLLSTSDYGTFDYIATLTSFIAPLLSMLVSESMFRFLIDAGDNKDRKTEVISQSFFIICCGIGIGLIIAIVFFSIFPRSYAIPLVLYVISMIINWQISGVLRGIGKIKDYTVFNLVISVSGILLNVITIGFLGMGLTGLYIANIIPSIVWSIIYFKRERLWNSINVFAISKDGIKEILKYSVPLVPNKLSWSIVDASDRLMVTNMIGADANGVYAIAYKFPTLVNTFYSFFYTAWTESSAKVLAQTKQEIESFYNDVYDRLIRILSSITFLFLTIMPMVYELMISENYEDSYKYVPFLLFGVFFSNISGIYGGVFTAYMDTKRMGMSTAIAAICNIVLNIILIERFGVLAAALSTLISNFLVAIIRRIEVVRYVAFKDNIFLWVSIFLVSLLCSIMYYSDNWGLYGMNFVIALAFSILVNMRNIHETILIIKKWGINRK